MNGQERGRVAAPAQLYRGDAGRGSAGFIESLSPEGFAAIKPLLNPVTFAAGETLYPAGAVLRDVFLIDQGLVSLSIAFADGHAAATTLIGGGGIVGACAAVRAGPTADNATVIVAGSGHRLAASVLRRLIEGRPQPAAALARTLAGEVTNLQAELACRTFHSVEQRLARLLLGSCEKLGTDRLVLTQEALAMMLGVQRTTVSALAARLKERGALAYLRGSVRVVDPARLAQAACHCGATSARTDGEAGSGYERPRPQPSGRIQAGSASSPPNA